MQINPYLNFNGNCAEAFKFYAEVLHGEIVSMMDHNAAPPEMKMDALWKDKILHVHLRVGDWDLFGSDAPPQYYKTPQGFTVSIGEPDVREGERIFKALSEGGQVTMPFEKTFWAERFGMCVDRFGTPWMVNCAPAA